MKRFVYVFLLSLLFCGTTSGQNTRPIGVNISDIGPWASQFMFVNVMKGASSWMAQPPDFSEFEVTDVGGVPVVIPLTANGYPAHSPFVVNTDTLIPHLMMCANQPAPWYYPSGDYTLIFEGMGTVLVQWDVVGGGLTFTAPNTAHTVPVIATDAGLDIAILSSDTSDPIRNIRLILPGHEMTYEAQPFLPEFIDLLAPFSAMRFMKPGAQEENAMAHWAERTPVGYYHYHSDNEGEVRDALPYELQVRLCNETDKDPWINVPVAATNGFIDSLAYLLRDSLDTARTIHIEYGNETWNDGYPFMHNYVDSMGLDMGLDSDPFLAGQDFHVLRSLQIFERFEAIFAGQESRLYGLIATIANPAVGKSLIDALNDTSVNPTGKLPHAISFAPYIGSEVILNLEASGDTCLVDEQDLLDSLALGIPIWMDEMGSMYQFWADSLGVDLVAYEGGQYLSSNYGLSPADGCSELNFSQANRDPRIKDIYCQYYDYWYDTLGGDLLMTFTLCEAYSPYGATGLVESVFQDPDTVPKYQAHFDCFQDTGLITQLPFSEKKKDLGMQVYPNPTTSWVNIHLASSSSTVQLYLSDLQGRRLQQLHGIASHEPVQLDLSSFPAGVYFLSLWDGAERVEVQKVVKY